MWDKTGNFNHTFNSGGELNRKVEYEHRTSDSLIKKISVLGYTDNDFRIIAEAHNQEKFKQIREEIVRSGFSAPDLIGNLLNQISLSTCSRDTLSLFMQAVRRTQPDCIEIMQDISEILGTDITETVTMPVWIREMDFSIISTGGPLNRQVRFINTNSDSVIKKLDVLGYSSGRVRIEVMLANPQRSELERQLAENFRLTRTFRGMIIDLDMDNRADRLIQLIAILDPLTYNLHEITTQIHTYIDSVQPEAPQTRDIAQNHAGTLLGGILQASLLQTSGRVVVPPPSAGSNFKKLEDIGCTDIPEEYCCQISCAIMSNPVYDPKHAELKFEKEWILRALEEKPENPFTRTPLSAADLKEDLELKDEITAFVEEKISEYNNHITGP